jgi:D-alanyl-D-alanine carboxypeptidase/D-alanyl-D-alanine-endopeptidase (penicillin-binding protein 4)
MQGVRTYDGSGLSRKNRLTPQALLATLRITASDSQPDLREVITGLPVAGFTGSLEWRFEDAPQRAKGLVRAKTGTLTGVHGLAGIVTDRTGAELGFVAIADRVAVRNTLEARKSIDELAAALGACACAG